MTRARIEYTVEPRGRGSVRRARECDASEVERTIDKLVDKGGFNFDVRYETKKEG